MIKTDRKTERTFDLIRVARCIVKNDFEDAGYSVYVAGVGFFNGKSWEESVSDIPRLIGRVQIYDSHRDHPHVGNCETRSGVLNLVSFALHFLFI